MKYSYITCIIYQYSRKPTISSVSSMEEEEEEEEEEKEEEEEEVVVVVALVSLASSIGRTTVSSVSGSTHSGIHAWR